MTLRARRTLTGSLLALLAILGVIFFRPKEILEPGASPGSPVARDATVSMGIPSESSAMPAAYAPAPVPSAALTTEDGGMTRTFSISLDEAVMRGNGGPDITFRLDPPATLETLPARLRELSTQGEVLPVCYDPDEPRSEGSRRIITRDITLKLPDPETQPALPPGVVLKERPSYAPGFAVVSAQDSFAALAALAPLRTHPQVVTADIQLASQRQRRAVPNDAFFGNEWHLKYQGQPGALIGCDVNIENAWLYGGSGGVRGSGIRIGIVDDSLQTSHPDFAGNIDTVNDFDWNGNDNDPSPGSSQDTHGTACAGNAAARGNNGIGVTGSAPEATLVGMRLISAATTDSQEAAAMAHLPQLIQIRSNSWGPWENTLGGPGSLGRAAIANTAANGRGGLGVIYLWAGGNGNQSNDNSNYDGFSNDIHAIGVAASDSYNGQAYYSEPGANILIAAPSSGILGVTTTDVTGPAGYSSTDYTDDFGGTSSATPTTAGIIALMLQKNPNLGWRDVKEILIRTAVKISPGDSDWANNAAGFPFNHKFGAGRVDATAAVAMAATWSNLAPATSQSSSQNGLGIPIPDNNPVGVSRSFSFTGPNLRVEHATVTLSAVHSYRGDLVVQLIAPSGMVSQLATVHPDAGSNYAAWTFSSVRHWGEGSQGTWTVKVHDGASVDTGTLTGVSVTLHGVPGATGNPGPVVQITSPATGTVFSPGIPVNVTVAASDLTGNGSTGTVSSVQLLRNGELESTDTIPPYNFTLGNLTVGAHTFTAIATDSESEATTSVAVSVTVVNQPPVVIAAEVSPTGEVFSDQSMELSGVLASDPEGEAYTLSYAWEKSSDALTWIDGGINGPTLPPSPANAGFLWRCRVIASDGTSAGPAFHTFPVNVLVRPPSSVALGQPFSYGSGLVLRGTPSRINRDALIHEFSQGPTEGSEWVEILTLREADFRGWKLDDDSSSPLVFAETAAWDSIPPGTLIVVYNASFRDTLLPADDNDPSDGRMILSSSDPAWFTGSWPGFSDTGDAVLLKKPAGTIVAGLSYGSSTTTTPVLAGIDTGFATFYTGTTDAGTSVVKSWRITAADSSRRRWSTRAPGDLFFSEYVEGSSNSKRLLEIYNPSLATVNLTAGGYKIEIYLNGSATPASTINLDGSVISGDVFVVGDRGFGAFAYLDQEEELDFGGDDAVVLKKGSIVVDAIGQVGVDPGSGWSSRGVSTFNSTLRRKPAVRTGDTVANDPFFPHLEWLEFPVDTVSGTGGVGTHLPDAYLTLSVSPDTFNENAGLNAATATVTLSKIPASNVVIDLASYDPTVVKVPLNVTVAAGQSSATFSISAVNDSESDGDQRVNIYAGTPAYGGVEASLTVIDDEPSLVGVTPGEPNSPANGLFVADVRSGILIGPSIFRFSSGVQVPAGLSIDSKTGVVSGIPTGPAGEYFIRIERYNVVGEVTFQDFILQVTGANGYAAWIASFPGLAMTGAGEDPDRDGMANLLEYHLGSLPGTPDAAASLPVLAKNGSTLTFTWWRIKSATDTAGTAQWSDHFGTWQTSGITTQVIAESPTREQVRATLTVGPGDTKKFLRLKVE